MTYAEKLRDPRWQRKRLEVLNRENFTCELCDANTSTLHVHHGYYDASLEPWDYDLATLHCVCESCHDAANELRKQLQKRAAALSIHAQYMLDDIVRWIVMIEAKDGDPLLER